MLEPLPRAPRIHRHCWARVHIGEAPLYVLVADFSRSGVRIIEPTASLEEADEIELEIHEESSEPFTITGSVARLTGDGYAVNFDVSPADRPRWMEYLRTLASA